MGILANAAEGSARLVSTAHPRRFLEVTGRRMALLGHESGVFECWMWPIKLFEAMHLELRPDGGRSAIAGARLVSRVEVLPQGLVLTYVHPEFALRQEFFAALDERTLVMQLELEGTRELEVDVVLECAMTPMWPAGLGGAIAARDEETGALVLTEELGRFAAFVGSPAALPLALEADHALAKEPVRIALWLSPRAKQPTVLVVAGAELDPGPLPEAARLGEADAARGFSRSKRVVDAARAAWRAVVRDGPKRFEDLRAHWKRFDEQRARVESGDDRLDEAFDWAQIAIEKAWVEVDGLGQNLVAGLAPSGGGARPGFGWFFDGDAMTASRALTGCGQFESVRAILRGAASRQRADGKLMHELVLSAKLCNWIEDYPYAYYKAGNTPAFVATLDHYASASGDLELARELWTGVKRAIEWCAGTCDARGLMSNKKAGLAAVEAGPLCGRIEAEVYLNGIWLSALQGAVRLAKKLGDAAFERRSDGLLEHARRGFESFWSEDEQRYGFALLEKGERCDDLNAYSAHPLSRGHGSLERIRATVAQLNRPELQSDWGTRMFSTRSSIYDPAHYNTGAVFPYLTTFSALALFEHGDPMAGWQVLSALANLHGFSGQGFLPEHLRGDRAVAPARGVPHQIFSSSALLQVVLYGSFGLRCTHGSQVIFRPALVLGALGPTEVTACAGRARVRLTKASERLEPAGPVWRMRADDSNAHDVEVTLEPRFPLGTRIAAVDGRPLDERAYQATSGRLSIGTWTLPARAGLEVRVEAQLGPSAWFGSDGLVEGAPSTGLRLLSTRLRGDAVVWRVAGLAGTRHVLPFRRGRATSIHGAAELSHPPRAQRPLDAVNLVVTLPAGEGFVEHEIVFELEV